jgi:hypothetical protein
LGGRVAPAIRRFLVVEQDLEMFVSRSQRVGSDAFAQCAGVLDKRLAMEK